MKKAMMVVETTGKFHVEVVPTEDISDFACEAVGGWTESVPVDEHLVVIVNEVGKTDGLPLNRSATKLFWVLGGDPGDDLRGNVVVGALDTAAIGSLSDQQIETLTRRLEATGAHEAR